MLNSSVIATREVLPSVVQPLRSRAFILATVTGVSLRLWLATLGHNYDVESFALVGGLVADGRNVYANTLRYNYGPIWFLVLGLIEWIMRHVRTTNVEAFHFVVASLLTAVDVAIAWLLSRRFDPVAGVLFLLCPVSMLITGFHSQFDNLAVLVGLIAWLPMASASSRRSARNVAACAVVMGLSLSIKHILVFFPLWVITWPAFGDLRRRLLYAVVTYGVFLAGFAPFAVNDAAIDGIWRHVFAYDSNTLYTLFEQVLQLFAPASSVVALFAWVPVFSGVKFLWLIAMVAVGWIAMRREPSHAVLYYLLAMVALSPSMAAQYFAIPLAAIAVHWRAALSWVYVLVGTVVIIQLPENIGSLPAMLGLQEWIGQFGILYMHVQIWLLALLITLLLRIERRTPRSAVSSMHLATGA